MSASVLLDTNILVYAYDADEPVRRQTAVDLLRQVRSERSVAAVSTQVLGEYSSVMLRKFAHMWDAESVEAQVREFSAAFEVLTTDTDVVLEAVRGVSRYGLSYYDAQIWAASRLNGIALVLSEDFTDGLEIEGVRFANPFGQQFDFSQLKLGQADRPTSR